MTVKFRGKNGDWAIPIVTFIIFVLGWIIYTGKQRDDLTQDSVVFLQSYGFTNIEVSDRPIGCNYDLVTNIEDGGRKFTGLKPNGKLISGVVCTTKDKVSKLTINYEEE